MTGGGMSISRRGLMAGLAGAGVAFPFGNAIAAAATTTDEKPIEPHLPIVDCHHHLHAYRTPQLGQTPYLPTDFARDIADSGHNVVQSIFVECSIMYRPDGPAELRSLGETEYVGAVSREAAAGRYGPCRIAAAMVGRVDLTQGAKVPALLELHVSAAGGCLRGVRNSIAWDAHPPLAAMGLRRDLLDDPAFRQGFAELAPLGLSFDIWLFHPQIADLTRLARAFPGTTIILNHLGSPLGIGPYADRMEMVFEDWKAAMADLARSPKVIVKLGGLGPFWRRTQGEGRSGSRQLAAAWRPYIETAISLFGVDRCMFESNWSANASVGSYGAHWNAFKRITSGCSADEKAALYSGTSQRIYRLT